MSNNFATSTVASDSGANDVRVGRRYRVSRLDTGYDAIVIGSGIGGLTTAACLSKEGKKVLVLEQHYTAGGYTHSYSRNGYEWGVGVHYIGEMNLPESLPRKLFDYVTDGKLTWSSMDENYDRFYLGQREINLRAGKENFRKTFVEAFPEEEEAIDRYIGLLDKATIAMQMYAVSKIVPRFISNILKLILPRWFNKTTYSVLSGLTKNEALIGAFTGQWGDCGVPPKKSSFISHSVIANHYINGGFYPVGGASEIARKIIPIIQRSGGDVFTYADVKEIVVEKNRAVGVRMVDGTVIRSATIVSNAGLINTFEKLLPETSVKRSGYAKQRKRVDHSMPHIGLYIGLKGTTEALNLPNTNFWIYQDEHHDENVARFLANPTGDYPLVYISFPSTKDPSYARRYPGTSTIEIVAPTSYEVFESWKDTAWGKRGEEYEALKEKIAAQLLEELFKKLPHLRGKIDYYEVSTPLSTNWFSRYGRGELYGLDHTPERFNQTWLRPKTQIAGLYLTGQDALGCGVVGAMIGGLLCTLSIQGLKGVPLAKRMFADPAVTYDDLPTAEIGKSAI